MTGEKDKANVIAMPDVECAADEAAEWIMALEGGKASAEQRSQFLAWRNASDLNKETFERLAALWDGCDNIKILDDLGASDEAADMIAEDRKVAWLAAPIRRPVSMAIAASLTLIIAIGILFQVSAPRLEQPLNVYQTAIGQQEIISLPDGSTVHLNTDSQIEILFSENERNIRLASGEAYFDVRRDAARPFSVLTEQGAVTALGTAFVVRLEEQSVGVTVEKGRVAVYASGPDDEAIDDAGRIAMNATANLNAGESVQFNEEIEAVAIIEPDVLARQLSWREGVLAFSGDALSDVIAEVGRYTDTKISIEDPELAAMQVVGYFKISDTEDMFEALQLMADLELERVGPREVRLVQPN